VADAPAILLPAPRILAAPAARNLWVETLRRLAQDRVALVGVCLIGLISLAAILGPLVLPYGYAAIDARTRLAPPGGAHLLGADELGRDLLSRTVWGARASLPISLVAVTASTVIGTLIGLLAGYYRGRFDMLAMRCMDILLAFPQLVLALALLAVLGPDIRNLVLALTISNVPGHARLARGMTLSIGAMQFTESARAVGARDWRIMLRYILPNALAPILISASASLGGLILAEAGLSFLGLGIQPPTPSWGMMLSQGRAYVDVSPWLMVWPGLAIFMAVLGFNLLGDGIRDATDPRLRRL
jgi:peptide/nickel transport system permease protein